MPEERATARNRESFLQKWKKIFVAPCLFAVVLDPLFLYVPMIKDDIKCLQSDRNLKIAALLLRSFTDLFYIFDIIVQVYRSDNFASKYAYRHRIRRNITFWSKSLVPIAKTMWGSYVILIDILAVLPLPQVAILVFFSKMRDLRSLNTIRMVIMNLFVLLQYVPRLLRIYLSCKEFKTTLKGDIRETPIWIKGVLNFFMYILAGHVFGAIWYFFAIQRVGICWHDACRKDNGCSASTFGCHDHHTLRNIAFLNDLCPISPMNATLFDFGIYTKILQSGTPGSTNYFQKFSNCFWLGLRHLSSFGSNLEPSIDGWENLFAAFVSIIGLLLFLYLIGNLQTYMQLDTARIEAYRHNMKVKQKMEKKDNETELWFSENAIPKRLHKDMKLKIMEKVRQELEENRDADLDYIFSILPLDLHSQITDYVHRHKMKGQETELWLSKNGIPKKLINDIKSQIMDKVRQEVEEDRDADMDKIFSILPKNLQSQITDYKHRDKMKGRETKLWLSKNGIPKNLINDIKSQIMDKVQQEVEDRDADMDKIFSILPSNLQSQITKYMPMTRLKQVPMLRNMDERVLREISGHLKPMEFDDNSIIIKKGKPLEMMLFIAHGLVSIEKRDGSSSSNDNLQQRPRVAGEVCGEELLRWPLSISFPAAKLTLATESAKAIGHVEALVLTARDLERVVEMDYFVGMMRRTFSAKELEKATDNYHQSRIIRKERGFATFYNGVLPMPVDDIKVVAVKNYQSMHTYAVVEAAVASQTNHINLVRFLGACVEPQTKALVFEYIPNGTLFEHIHKEEEAGSFEGSSSSTTALLSLELRLKIASETAGALAYLHSLTPPIIHLSLSTKHILLNYHHTAKLSAIGRYQTGFRGPEEYFDPYFEIDRLAEKSDVYSFGVILAELLTSQNPASPNSGGAEPPLAICLLSSMEEGRLNQILDGKIIFNEATSETAKKVADLAKRCLRSKRKERPSMAQVAEELAQVYGRVSRGKTQFLNQAKL